MFSTKALGRVYSIIND